MKWFHRTFDLDGAGAGGGSAAAAAGSPVPDLVKAAADAVKEAPAAGPAKSGEGAAAAGPYFPQGLDPAWKGASERETLDKIAKHWGERPRPPEKPEGYELKLSEDMTKRFPNLTKDDRALPIYRQIAHEIGMTGDQFNGFLEKFHTGMAKAGLIDDPVQVDAQLESLARSQAGDAKQRRADGAQRVNSAVASISALVTRDVLTEMEAAAFINLATDVHGVTGIEKIISKLGKEHGVQVGGQGGGGSDLSDPAEQARLMYPNSQKK